MSSESGGVSSSKAAAAGFGYTIPRLISNSIHYIFSTYLGELYIERFKWKPGDFGMMTSIFSFTLGISHLTLGIGVNFIGGGSDEQQQQGNSKENSSLDSTKNIEIVCVGTHAVTFFLLIFLPIIWSGTRLKSLDALPALIGKMLGKSPVIISQNSSIPAPGSIPYAPSGDPGADLGLDSVPARNPVLAVLFSKKTIIYFISIIHGIAFTTFDLCNRAIPTYVTSNVSSIQIMDAINLGGYGIVMLLMNTIVSCIKSFFGNKIEDVDLFFVLTVVILLLQFPVFYLFATLTTPFGNTPAPAATQNTGETKKEDGNECCCSKNAITLGQAGNYIKLTSATIFHSAVSFWISTGGPLIQYLTANVLGEDEKLKNFGPFVLLATFTATTLGYTLYNMFFGGGGSNKNECCCKKKAAQAPTSEGSTTTNGSYCICDCDKRLSSTKSEWVMAGACVFGQFFIFFMFFRYGFDWNKGNLMHFIIFGINGAVYGAFLLNIGAMLNGVLVKKEFQRHKWMILGFFFSITHLSVSISVFMLYKYYDQGTTTADSDVLTSSSPPTIGFTGVYKIISFIYQIATILAAVGYYLEDVIKLIQMSLPIPDDGKYKDLTAKLDPAIETLE